MVTPENHALVYPAFPSLAHSLATVFAAPTNDYEEDEDAEDEDEDLEIEDDEVEDDEDHEDEEEIEDDDPDSVKKLMMLQ
jgi:hypothetical protein